MMVPHDNWIIQNSLRPEKPVAEEKLAKPGAGRGSRIDHTAAGSASSLKIVM